jgi:GntR family transcriptional repressor for pyruvate dehydrogenase complex
MDDLFTKISQKKVSDRVIEQIRGLITAGRLNPGDRLPPERELVSQFAVSRSSVREAILKLECMGFVEQRHGEGTFVRSVTDTPMTGILEACREDDDFLSDLMEIRIVLETWAAAAAAERATEADIAAMEAVLEEMRTAGKPGGDGLERNVRLHALVWAAARNTFLTHVMNTIIGWIGQVTHKVYSPLSDERETYEAFCRQHRAVVSAVAARKPEDAYRAMADHLRYARDRADGTEANADDPKTDAPPRASEDDGPVGTGG